MLPAPRREMVRVTWTKNRPDIESAPANGTAIGDEANLRHTPVVGRSWRWMS
ncbi:MAG: hypothetical protein AB7O62_12815 [Pirellulales bacterium]